MKSELITTEYGPISADFQTAKLSELCVEKIGVQTGPFGSQLHQADYVEIGTPIITVEHLGENRILHENTPFVSDADRDRLSRYSLQEGDIIFSRVGSVDRRSLVRKAENGWLFSGRCLRVRVKKDLIDPVYLSYFFGHEGFKNYLRSIAVGATMPSINTKILSDVPIYFPDLEDQKRIGEILLEIDNKIELNRQINQTLEQIAQTIFKSWFVDFEPVKAKAAGRDRERAAMCAISGKLEPELVQLSPEQYQQLAATAALFPDELVESELGLIPEGWEVKALPEAIEVNPSRTLKKGVIAPYLDMANVPTNSARVAEVIQREFGSGSKFMNGDTLLARITPCLENGKTAYVDFLADKQVGWGSTEFIVLRPKAPLPEVFGYLLCRHPEFRAFAIANMSGTSGRQRVPNDCFANYKFAAPDAGVAAAFGAIVGSIMAGIKIQDGQARTLATLRDTLLPKLLSGELSVYNSAMEAAI